MNNTKNWSLVIQRISTFLLLIAFVIQIISIIFMESDLEIYEIEELHEISGFVFLGLMLFHIVLHYKRLKSIFLSKTK
jgi:cytochrome b561